MSADVEMTKFASGAVRNNDAAGVRFDLITPIGLRRLSEQFVCPECGAVRICHPKSLYAVCPNGHGRLMPRFTQADLQQTFAATLPRARRVGRNRFKIAGHKGVFGYRNGSGRRRAVPDTVIQADEVIARHVVRKRQLIRVFARRASDS